MILKLLALNFVALLGMFALVQAIIVAIYCRYMRPRPYTGALKSEESCAVLMALRGADRNLDQTLIAHLQQRDVVHHLHWIVDSEHDPAVAVIRQLPAELANRWTLHVLELNSDQCSLKCLGLSQVVQRLLASTTPPKYFAFADGDGLVSQDWLRRMLDPMVRCDQQRSGGRAIGATTGHRWYTCFPRTTFENTSERASEMNVQNPVSWGAFVRYFWNLGSLPQMHLYRVVWGGSWAIRAEVLQNCGLLESWKGSLFEDTQVRTYVESAGHRVVTAPGVLVQSYEPTSVGVATNWISRQLLDMRLYHPSFLLTVFHAGFLALIHTLIMIVAVLAAVQQDWWTVWTLVAGLLTYQAFYAIVWWRLQRTAEGCLSQLDFDRAVNHPESNRKASERLWASVGLLLTQVMYPLATGRALLTQAMSWRGINYRIDGPKKIQRLNYEIYRRDELEHRSDSA
ncbi:MAG: glycosyltransferase family 2 protein [Pirellulaceae bacterium]|nr:glycosyltransferase family 2 protein [Pirellulaceae bacterium]